MFCGNIVTVKLWNATIQLNAWADGQIALLPLKRIIRPLKLKNLMFLGQKS